MQRRPKNIFVKNKKKSCWPTKLVINTVAGFHIFLKKAGQIGERGAHPTHMYDGVLTGPQKQADNHTDDKILLYNTKLLDNQRYVLLD